MSVHQLRPAPTVLSGSLAAKGLRTALALLDIIGVPEPPHVHMHANGDCLTFDYSASAHPVADVRTAAALLGIVEVQELATVTPSGADAIELRAQEYLGGILRTFRAVVPLEPRLAAL